MRWFTEELLKCLAKTKIFMLVGVLEVLATVVLDPDALAVKSDELARLTPKRPTPGVLVAPVALCANILLTVPLDVRSISARPETVSDWSTPIYELNVEVLVPTVLAYTARCLLF